MAKKVTWSRLAVNRYEHVIQYLLSEWTERDTIKFINKVGIKLLLVSRFPSIGRKTFFNNSIRQILLSKHNRLIYKIEKSRIVVLDIFDTRQEEI